MTETSIGKAPIQWHSRRSDSHDKTALQHSSKCLPGRLQRPPQMLEVAYWWRRKVFKGNP